MILQPKISVIVPIYNTEKYLSRCIGSIQRQTYSNMEIILVNDGSSDTSIDICNQHKKQDKRIILINKQNSGVASARNAGLDYASGDFIGFVDSDDYIAPEMYEKLLEAAIKFNADIVECGYIDVNSNKMTQIQHHLKATILRGNYECSRTYLLHENTTNFSWNKLFGKKIFSELRFPHFAYSEDYVVNTKAFYECTLKVTIAGCYYFYRHNEEGACNASFKESKLDMLEAGKNVLDFHSARFSDLCPLVIIYILEHIIMIYRQLRQKKDEPYKTYLLGKYKYYYFEIKRNAFYKKLSRKRKYALLLFHVSPVIYLYISKIHRSLKKQNNLKHKST